MGQVVSFYSFKGGTGRSTSLSNIAYQLAKEGASVGCMDFDLSAAGLHWIYDIGPNRVANTKSIHNRLSSEKANSGDMDDYIIDLARSYRDDDIQGELYLMPGEVDGSVVQEIKQNAGTMHRKMREIIGDFEARYDLDYLFLDSRSGISSQAMPIFDQADILLTFTRWTHQHKLGTSELISWILGTQVELDDVICMASNVPNSVPESKIAEWVTHELHHDVEKFQVVNESELLKEKERILTKEKTDSKAAKQYRKVADVIDSI